MAGIRAALALAVDGIEFDVRCSADGVPVLIHDETLDRTTDGSGRVSDLAYAQLRALDAGDRYAGAFAGERIPSLREAIDLAAGRCLLVIEIKQRGIAGPVVNELRRADALASAMVWSFDAETAAVVRRLEPRLPAALLALPPAGDAAALLEAALTRHLAGVSLRCDGVDAALVRAARLRGLCVYAWTANDAQEQRRLTTCGVDAIVSDVPALLRQTLQQAVDVAGGG